MQNKHRNKTNVNISIYAERPLFFRCVFYFVLFWSVLIDPKNKHDWMTIYPSSLIAMKIIIFMKFIMNNFYKLRLVFVGINFNIRQTL